VDLDMDLDMDLCTNPDVSLEDLEMDLGMDLDMDLDMDFMDPDIYTYVYMGLETACASLLLKQIEGLLFKRQHETCFLLYKGRLPPVAL
jgi:hypothetical protein